MSGVPALNPGSESKLMQVLLVATSPEIKLLSLESCRRCSPAICDATGVWLPRAASCLIMLLLHGCDAGPHLKAVVKAGSSSSFGMRGLRSLCRSKSPVESADRQALGGIAMNAMAKAPGFHWSGERRELPVTSSAGTWMTQLRSMSGSRASPVVMSVNSDARELALA